MSFLYFIKLLLKNAKLLVIIPAVLAGTVYYFTRNEIKVYSSESVVYTGIASGYNLNGNNRADYFATSNAFDNLLSLINSRETKEEVAIRLLSEHLFLKKHDPEQLSWGSYSELQKLIPDTIRQKLVKNSVEKTDSAVNKFMQGSDNNLIYQIINSDNPFYSVNALNHISALRVYSSDLIKISYSTQDAAICKRTLELLEETFMRKHKMLREGQTESVIAYFESETKRSFNRLDSAEKVFLDFNKNNDIINYYEQTKAVAGEKESLYALNHQLEMEQQADSKALSEINTQLEGRSKQAFYGSEIIAQRHELSELYNNIALYETLGADSSDAEDKLSALKDKTSQLEKKLRNTVDELYVQNTTPGGIPSKEMLDEWLKTSLAYEQSKARLTVMDKRKKEFEEEYSKFAPLGAMLKKIERQISVAEQEYLEMLHGLNLARLTQQNNELTSKLTVVDPPYLPLRANASIRMILVAVSFIAGFIIILAFILAKALVNQTLLEPVRAAKKTEMTVLGVYPLMCENEAMLRKASQRLLQQFLSIADANKKPLTVGIISVQQKEGKTQMCKVLKTSLVEHGIETTYNLWKKDAVIDYSSPVLHLTEFPALENFVYTAASFPHLDHVIIVCRANRVWTKLDKSLVANFKKTTGIEPKVILNGVEMDFAEEYIGEAQKKRTWVRTFIKRVAKMQFGNRKIFGGKKKYNTGNNEDLFG